MKSKSIFIILVFLLFLVSCKSPAGPDTNGSGPETPAVYPPQPGDWTSTTTFGSFEINVNGASTHVTKILFTFANWMGRSGSVSVSKDPGWSITNRSFKIETSLMGDQWTVEGTFENSGTKAAGTWTAVLGGQTESGSWSATPKT
jgi:hypothetical protein